MALFFCQMIEGQVMDLQNRQGSGYILPCKPKKAEARGFTAWKGGLKEVLAPG
jgi:hypothetical protein